MLALILTATMVPTLLFGALQVTAATEPIKIGVVSDRSSYYIYYGEMELNGLYLGIEYATNGTFEVIGRPIEILVEDSGIDVAAAVAKAKKLIEESGVHILQAHPYSPCASAIQAVAKEYGVIFMVAPAAASAITAELFNKYTFRTASTTGHDANTGGKWAVRLGKKIAFLAIDNIWGRSTVTDWTNVIIPEGGEVVHTEYVPVGTVDFRPYIERVKAANPNVLVPVWAGLGSTELFAQMAELEVYKFMNVTSGIGDLAGIQALGAPFIGYTGMCKYSYALPRNPVNDWFVNRWRERYDADTLFVKSAFTLPVPDLFTACSFAAGQAIVYAIKEAGTVETEKLIKVLEGMEFVSPKGLMWIRPEDHQAMQEMYIARVINDTSIPEFPKGFLRPELVDTLSPEETAPAIASGYTPAHLATDLNFDEKINIIDVSRVAKAFGSYPFHPRWDPRADIDHNGKIDIRDVAKVAKDFGKTTVDP
jgi:branched-chain amino acid transport system substrate-binding protein